LRSVIVVVLLSRDAVCPSRPAGPPGATAVVLWPIARRQGETVALSYVVSRVVESTVTVVGLVSLLSVAAKDQLSDRGDKGQEEQHADDARAPLLLRRRGWHTGS
jgi:hypothetical protein